LVLLEGLVDHASIRPVIEAARTRGIAVFYARRAGVERVSAILEHLSAAA
jgi:hypothetical protein